MVALLASILYRPSPANPYNAPIPPLDYSAASQALYGPSEPRPADVVILADESGSISPDELTGEREAAALIALGELSPQSQVAILGFGSAPAGAQPSAAIDHYCGLTAESSPSTRQRLIGCGHDIRRRTQAQGSYTDFAAALNQALTLLRAVPAGTVPLVFFLTGGKLDVGPESPYAPPGSPNDGNTVAQGLIAAPKVGILARLRQARIGVWPVGFGHADPAELSLFANGGARSACTTEPATNPSATMISPGITGEALTGAIETKTAVALASARCLIFSSGPSSSPSLPPGFSALPPGKSVSRPITVGPLTTSASIIVDKGDPRVIVDYIAPDGQPIADNTAAWRSPGSLGGATYESANGPSSTQEELRLTNPPPGPWTVTFIDPSGVPAQQVNAVVLRQGTVTLALVTPTIGVPGHRYRLAVHPALDLAPISASSLRTLTVRLQVTWPGGKSVTLPGALDSRTGEFTATVLVPAGVTGTATVTATVVTHGVQGTSTAAFPVEPLVRQSPMAS